MDALTSEAGMNFFADFTIQLLLALTIAVTIERSMEVLKAVYDLLDSRFNYYIFWTKKTIRIKKKLEKRLRKSKTLNARMLNKMLKKINTLLLEDDREDCGDDPGPKPKPVLSGNLVRAFYVRLHMRIFSILLGIGAAYLLSIDFIGMWKVLSNDITHKYFPSHVGMIFSGICIGYGTGPVHFFISRIERKKKLREMNREGKFYEYVS